jgi:hypothetical protein
MANTVTKQKIADNERNAIVHVWLASDGAAGELTDEVVVDVSDLSGSPSSVEVVRMESTLTGFSATLEWDATTDVPFLQIPADTLVQSDWRDFGGLQNNAGAGVTGDIVLTTAGFSAATDKGHITFWLKKS